MKILSISLKNLASFAGEATLDFRTPPLCHAGVFAIIGPTGSGKSTILDALCLALYGNTPRANASNRAKILVEGDEGWTAQDPRHLMRRGADEAFASVLFEAESVVYEATWRCRRATRGARNLKDAELELRRGGEVIALAKKGVNEKVAELTGLDFESFCRSVLLPQGQFERFLTCDSKERSTLLEALTDPAGLYRGVSLLAHERGGAAKEQIQKAEEEMRRVVVLTDAERAELDARLAQHEAEATRAQEAHAAATEARARHAAIDAAAKNRADKRADTESCEAARVAAEPERRTLADARAAQPLRATGKRRDETAARAREAEGELARLVAALAQAHDAQREAAANQVVAAHTNNAERAALDALRPQLERARSLDADVARTAADLSTASASRASLECDARQIEAREAQRTAGDAALREARAAVEAWLSAHPEAAALAAQRGVWEAALDDYAQTNDALAKARTLRDALTEATARLAADAARAEAARADAERLASEARQAADEATQRADAHRAADARTQREAIGQREAGLDTLRVSLDRRRTDRHDSATRRDEANDAEAQRSAHDVARAALVAEVARLDAALEDANRAHALAQARASFDEHRRALVAGEPCLVCGSTAHPWADPTALPASEADEGARLKGELGAARESLRLCERALVEATQRAKGASEEAARLDARLAAALPALAAACAQLGLGTDPDTDTHAASVDALRATLTEQRVALDAATRSADDAEAAERAAKDHRDSRADALRAAAQGAAQATQRQHDAHAKAGLEAERIADFEVRIRQCEARAADALAAVPGAVAAFRADPRDRREAWSQLADAYGVQQATHARLADEARALESARVELDTARQVLDARRAPLETQIAALEARRETLGAERAALFAGRRADDVEREAKARVAACEAALAAATLAAARAQHDTTVLGARRDEHAKHLGEHRVQAEEAYEKHAGTLAALGLDEDEAARRLALGDDALAALQATLERLDSDATAAAALLAEAQNALKSAESRRPAESPEALDAAIAAHAERRDTVQQRLGADRQQRTHDAAQRSLRDDRQRELDTIRDREGIWGELASLIGSNDGSSFALYAQSLAFDSLLASANEQLARLHPRYALRRLEEAAPDTAAKKTRTTTLLDMVVVDRELADAMRPVSTLSGGERFLVSLALALGLSTLASQRRKLASMFIDEGFGTLDPETLGTALSVLDALQARGTRVGVISHVSELKERLQARVVVQRRGDGTSTLRVEG